MHRMNQAQDSLKSKLSKSYIIPILIIRICVGTMRYIYTFFSFGQGSTNIKLPIVLAY